MKFSSIEKQLEFVKRILNQSTERDSLETSVLVIFIHSIDMGMLKGSEWLDVLAELAQLSLIRFVISVDNIKAGVLFTDQLIDQFGFVCVQMDTFSDYTVEREQQPDLFSAKNDNQELGLAFILKSMTENQRKIIKEVAKYQLKNPGNKGIGQKELLHLCIDQMLCHSNHQLTGYLHEAFDHKIVLKRVDEQGTTLLYMNYPTLLL